MRALPALVAFALLFAGCLGQSGGPAPLPTLPALLAGEAVRIDAEQPAREPTVVEAPDGTLYVSGFWGFGRVSEYPGTPGNILQAPLLWRSADAGATWQRVDTGVPFEGAVGNSDNDLAVGADGTLYYTSLSYYSPIALPASPPAAPPGAPDSATTLTVVVGATRDGGASWTWTRLDEGGGRSHPWVAAAPDGRAHVVWADGQGIRHVVSEDRGATWAQEERVHTAGEAGSIVASPGGALAVRVSPIGSDADGVAVSEDGGATWEFRAVPGDRTDTGVRGFDPVAFDAAGLLYAAWNEGAAIRVAVSRDLGRTWDAGAAIPEADGEPYYPYVRGGAPGEAVVSWFVPEGETVAARIARISGAHQGAPQVRTLTLEGDTGGTNHADYYGVALLRDGSIGAPVPMTTPDAGQWFDYRAVR